MASLLGVLRFLDQPNENYTTLSGGPGAALPRIVALSDLYSERAAAV